MLNTDDETQAITLVAERLAVSFPDVPAEVVQERGAPVFEEFTGRPIRDFVPVLVERMAGITSALGWSATRSPLTDWCRPLRSGGIVGRGSAGAGRGAF